MLGNILILGKFLYFLDMDQDKGQLIFHGFRAKTIQE